MNQILRDAAERSAMRAYDLPRDRAAALDVATILAIVGAIVAAIRACRGQGQASPPPAARLRRLRRPGWNLSARLARRRLVEALGRSDPIPGLTPEESADALLDAAAEASPGELSRLWAEAEAAR